MTPDVLAAKTRVFDRWAPNYDWLFTTVFYQAVHQRLLSYVHLPSDSPAAVLDMGCGTGKLLNRLASQYPQLQGTGLDLSPEMLRQARSHNGHRPRLIFVQGASEAMPFADHQFRAAFSTISFLHYPDPQQVFKEIGRILQPEGQFYLVDYTPFFGLGTRQNMAGLGGPMHFYSSQQRENLAAHAGLICNAHHPLLGPVLLSVFQKPV
ncbi:class I SAM-dependent methyltransferase [Acaryochloris sp. IP29b_bin.148]|uniref:class I SAM-dependent methyltransferase n=1 Tax=Acaryochloris sp. IP29b_bin.148 TaxID=2969218 RepID=UPI002616F579|nr:class I SAM-dependent methyltransferase [Acaryochloris sp. IP29b_bin.148]